MTRHSKVSAPVSVDEMLPNENGCYTCYVHKKVSGSHSITTRLLQFNPANKSWIGLEDKEYVTHWLEEKENVYVLTEEEYHEIIGGIEYFMNHDGRVGASEPHAIYLLKKYAPDVLNKYQKLTHKLKSHE